MSNRFELIETTARKAVAFDPAAEARTALARLRAFIATPRGWRLTLAWGFVLLGIALLIYFGGQRALVRYQSYQASAFDLGNMDQAVWNTLHGHPFRFTNRGLDWNGPPTRLGIHVEPILLLIAPLYLIHQGPATLIALQSVALALGAIPIFLLGLRRLPGHPLVAAALAGAYLVTPALLGSFFWDFHPVALAMPLLALAIWALDARRYGWFVAAAVLAALTKEDVALSLIPLGIALILWRGKPRLGAGVVAASLVWVGVCFLVILPHFDGGASGGNNYWYRYAALGATPGAAIVNLLTHPWLLVGVALGDAGKRTYLTMLLRMSGGLGIFAPALWVCALPELAVNLLSAHVQQYSGFFQYNAMLGAYLPAAAVYGVAALYATRRDAPDTSLRARVPVLAARLPARLRVWWRRAARDWLALLARIPVSTRWLGPLVIGWLMVSTLWNLQAIMPQLALFWTAGARPVRYQEQMDALLARVPANATVAASDTLDPHLSDRYTIYLVPDPRSWTAQYVAIDAPHADPDSEAADRAMLNAMLASGRYKVLGTAGEIVLLYRTGPPIIPPAPAQTPPATSTDP